MAIAQCARCPKAYHLKCYPKEKILKLTKKIIICQDHKFDNKIAESEKGKQSVTPPTETTETKKKGSTKEATVGKDGQLKIQKAEGENSMVIKIGKVENNENPEDKQDDLDDIKIPKKKGKPGPKKIEKVEEKKEERKRVIEKKKMRNSFQ